MQNEHYGRQALHFGACTSNAQNQNPAKCFLTHNATKSLTKFEAKVWFVDKGMATTMFSYHEVGIGHIGHMVKTRPTCFMPMIFHNAPQGTLPLSSLQKKKKNQNC